MSDKTDIPRRNRRDLNTAAEIAIADAMRAVEQMGAHRKLTTAVAALGVAFDSVADVVDERLEEAR